MLALPACIALACHIGVFREDLTSLSLSPVPDIHNKIISYLQLQGMEEELRAAPPSYRNAMSTKLRLYRRDLGKLQRDMKTSAPGLGSTKQPLEGGHHGIYSSQNQQSVSSDFVDVNPVE